MSFYAHDDAWRQWREAIAGGRMHHAWLFTGREGLGKSEFAHAAAFELVTGETGSPSPRPHSDILRLSRGPKDDKEEKKRDEGKPFELKRNITVSQIRRMQRQLVTRPTMGSNRVVIIDPADDMEAGAANALLKSLEEPPQGTYFVLISHRPAKLLPTIRSRCRTVRFPVKSDDEIRKFLNRTCADLDSAACEAAVAAAGGSPGSAAAFAQGDCAANYSIMTDILQTGDRDHALRARLQSALGTRPDRDALTALLELARIAIAQNAAGMTHECFPNMSDAHSRLVELAAQVPVYNFDPGVVVAEIGRLLAGSVPSTDRHNA